MEKFIALCLLGLASVAVPSAAAVDRCMSCAYVGGSSSDADINSALSVAGSSFGSDSSCFLGTSSSTSSCGSGEMCMNALATFTLKSDQGGSATVSGVIRDCVEPSSIASKFEEATCYLKVERDTFKEYLDYFESESLEVKNFDAVVCFCDDENNCNEADVVTLANENGTKGHAAKIEGVGVFFLCFCALVAKVFFAH